MTLLELLSKVYGEYRDCPCEYCGSSFHSTNQHKEGEKK